MFKDDSDDNQIMGNGLSTFADPNLVAITYNNNSSRKIRIMTNQSSSTNNLYTVNEYDLDVWYHLVFTRSGNEAKIYLDGQLENSGIVNDGDIGDHESWTLGRGKNEFGLFVGLLDEVRVYNRVLSEGEIKSLYTGCILQDSDGDGVVDDWDQCPDTSLGSFVDNKGCAASASSCTEIFCDWTGDGKIGLDEVIYALQIVSNKKLPNRKFYGTYSGSATIGPCSDSFTFTIGDDTTARNSSSYMYLPECGNSTVYYGIFEDDNDYFTRKISIQENILIIDTIAFSDASGDQPKYKWTEIVELSFSEDFNSFLINGNATDDAPNYECIGEIIGSGTRLQ